MRHSREGVVVFYLRAESAEGPGAALMQTPIRTLGELVDVVQELIDSTGKHVYAEDLQAVLDRVHGQEEVCAIDHDTGLLVVTTEIGAPTVRLALRRGDTNEIVYVTYTRTAERDDDGRPIYR